MPVATRRRKISDCDLGACRLHDERGACSLAGGILANELAAVFEPGGALEQDGCPLIRGLLPAFRRLHFGDGQEPDRDELVAHLYIALHEKLVGREPPPTVNTSYVFAAMKSWVVDQVRGSDKKYLCGACHHYRALDKRCGFPGSPYTDQLLASTNPDRLDPPCGEFTSRLDFDALENVDPAGASVEDLSVLLELVMEELRRADPEGHLVFSLHRLRGRSLRWIARERDLDRRHLSRVYERAEARFQRILGDWA